MNIMNILNLTQHVATADQTAAGVIEPADKSAVQNLLTFNALPSREELAANAAALAEIAKNSGCDTAMIGGAPFFMASLEEALWAAGIQPVYAFSERVSVETVNSDGTVSKTNVFKHVGFVAA